VLAWSNDTSEIAQIKTNVGAAISKLGLVPRHNTVSLPFLLWAGCPGNAADFPYEDTMIMKLPETTCFWSLETCFKDSPSTFGIKLVDRFTGRPLHVDISDYPMEKGIIYNRNKVIIGPSGSGKSFFTNNLVCQYYEQDSHVVMVDIGHSYFGLCGIINKKTGGKDGIYITHSEDNPISFNPFYTDDGVFPDEKINSIVALIGSLWKKEGEVSSKIEDVTIKRAVRWYIKKIKDAGKNSGSFNEFYEFVRDEYKDFLKKRNVELSDQDFSLGKFLFVLDDYYRDGEYEYLLNSTAELDLLKKRFIVFELDNIKDDPILLAVATIIVMETTINKMRRLPRSTRKMI
jgi:conjugation system TraG family ATPase